MRVTDPRDAVHICADPPVPSFETVAHCYSGTFQRSKERRIAVRNALYPLRSVYILRSARSKVTLSCATYIVAAALIYLAEI